MTFNNDSQQLATQAMANTTTIAINIHPSVFDAIVNAKGRNTGQIWLHAASQLQPGRGPQLVDLSDITRTEQKAIPELIELGLLRPRKGSKTKYYIPRAKAFASIEPTLETLMEQNP